MQNSLRVSKGAIAGIIVLCVLLVLVRLFQEQLFYDPFLKYFQGENYHGKLLPVYDTSRLGLNLFFRYALNTMLSLGILWLVFRDKSILNLSAMLYGVFFVIFIVAFYIVLAQDNPNMLALFYIRRFIIQPLFLILFLPAFYYQNKAK